MFDGICKAYYHELDKLDEELGSGKVQLSRQHIENIDYMVHTLTEFKKMEKMDDAVSEWDGGSYARGRSRTTGRYISRDGYDPRDGSYERRY